MGIVVIAIGLGTFNFFFFFNDHYKELLYYPSYINSCHCPPVSQSHHHHHKLPSLFSMSANIYMYIHICTDIHLYIFMGM